MGGSPRVARGFTHAVCRAGDNKETEARNLNHRTGSRRLHGVATPPAWSTVDPTYGMFIYSVILKVPPLLQVQHCKKTREPAPCERACTRWRRGPGARHSASLQGAWRRGTVKEWTVHPQMTRCLRVEGFQWGRLSPVPGSPPAIEPPPQGARSWPQTPRPWHPGLRPSPGPPEAARPLPGRERGRG